MRSTLRRLIPDAAPVSNRESLRSATGAFVGILLTGLLGSLALRFDPTLPAMIAPMGASAVLLFAVPSSPLAQPWSILCGNLVSAFVGVTVALLVPDPFFASALAISLAIAAMMALRCLHPPSGAVALTAVLGGPAVHSLGYGFLLWPVAGNSLILLAMALVYNNATGRAYPHGLKLGKAAHGTTNPTPVQKIGFSSTDLNEVLKEYDEFIDIDRDALETILRKTELRSYRRRALHLDCASVMSRDRPSVGFLQRLRLIFSGASAPNDTVKDIMTSPVKTLMPETSIEEAIIRFAEEGLHYLPVIDARGKMVGIVSQSDVMVAMLADKVAT